MGTVLVSSILLHLKYKQNKDNRRWECGLIHSLENNRAVSFVYVYGLAGQG